MITIEQAITQLQAWVETRWVEWAIGRGRWPYRIRLRPPSISEPGLDLLAIQNWAGRWARESDRIPGSVEWVSRRAPGMGTYRWPNRLVISSAQEALDTVPAVKATFERTVTRLQQAAANPNVAWDTPEQAGLATARAIAALDETEWSAALRVVDYLSENPVADMMIRQLPIPGVNTKWVEQHANLILALMRPPDAPRVSGDALTQLQHHIGLKARETTVNVALRCPRLRAAAGGLERFAASITVLNASALRPRALLIAENAELGHTFTVDIDGLAVIFGLGKAATILAGLTWLGTADKVIYWGDIDRAGLQCLAALRRAGVNADSILMDLDTLERYARLSHSTASQDPNYAIPGGLTGGETALYEHLNDFYRETGEDLQLEQERILIAHAEAAVANIISHHHMDSTVAFTGQRALLGQAKKWR
ncbi:Wadjet anti-phage system protein JetD domain-containing protein [Mycobacterium sherrisii]|uniref:Wadjet anti-phage system protein JetD domain-containing protein n=1 Tax=Mycobacterium sherrisii TaxID=243061 RepID=UPI003974E731